MWKTKMDGICNNVAEDFGVGCCLMVRAEVVSVGRFASLESGAGWKVTMLCCLRTDSKPKVSSLLHFQSAFGRSPFSKNWRTPGCLAGCLLTDWRFGLGPRHAVDLLCLFVARRWPWQWCGPFGAVPGCQPAMDHDSLKLLVD